VSVSSLAPTRRSSISDPRFHGGARHDSSILGGEDRLVTSKISTPCVRLSDHHVETAGPTRDVQGETQTNKSVVPSRTEGTTEVMRRGLQRYFNSLDKEEVVNMLMDQGRSVTDAEVAAERKRLSPDSELVQQERQSCRFSEPRAAEMMRTTPPSSTNSRTASKNCGGKVFLAEVDFEHLFGPLVDADGKVDVQDVRRVVELVSRGSCPEPKIIEDRERSLHKDLELGVGEVAANKQTAVVCAPDLDETDDIKELPCLATFVPVR